MKLDLNDLQVTSFNTVAEKEAVIEPAATGPEGPYSLCWICRPTDPGVPSCDYTCGTCWRSCNGAVDSYCMCYA